MRRRVVPAEPILPGIVWSPAVDGRAHGVDSTDEFDTLVEATLRADGTVHFEVVQLDKRPDPG